jgi:iron complex transport system ATP-binding protein
MHDLNMAARFSDEICVLQAGEVVSFGKARNVMTSDLLSHVYETPISVEKHPKLDHLVVYTH